MERERQKYHEKLWKLEQDEQKYRKDKENLESQHQTDYGAKEAALEWFNNRKAAALSK